MINSNPHFTERNQAYYNAGYAAGLKGGQWLCDGDRAIDRYAYTAGYNDGRSAPAKARGVS